MKYFLGFPISFHCNLRCTYCFNSDFYNYIDNGVGENVWHDKRTFSFDDYRRWRDKHLSDATEIIMHLYGGEPFCKQNVEDVFSIIDFVDNEKIDLLSNGTFESGIIDRIVDYKDKIHQIGFTFHRKILSESNALKDMFERNVLSIRDAGIKVYVKELLIKSLREDILQYNRFWKSNRVEFKIQDFKGEDRGLSSEEYSKYTPIDRLLVHHEFKHGNPCSCRKGYKNLFIRGFDEKNIWPKGGDVIACWFDPTVVGSIPDDWFDPKYVISVTSGGKRDVKFVKKIYRGDHERDLPLK